jgi:glycosyltransferase involved in cell wall biosynthesis
MSAQRLQAVERTAAYQRRRLRLLFIARAYPPTVGGMENLAYQLGKHLDEFVDVVPLVNRGGKKALPAFLPYAAMTAVRLARSGRIDAVHLADALLAPVGAMIKAACDVPVTASVCGLDVTYANRGYQAIVPRALRRLDAVMPISRATETAMRARTGIDAPRSSVIALGVNPLPPANAAARAEFTRATGDLDGKRVVVTVGRLIERKGVAWFVGQVVPRLPDDVIYVVVGDGPQREAIARAAADADVAHRVRMTGRVSDGAVAAAYARADVFVMPNVPVPGDIEGFGLVALEAAASGVPVIAADLEGIREAVQHKRNGLLVRPRDAAAMTAAVCSVLELPANARRSLGLSHAHFTNREYGWRKTAERHAAIIAGWTRDVDLKAAA